MASLYEIVTIINPNESDEGVDAIVGGLRQQITTSGGTVLHVDKWGRKRLAYPIAAHEDGIYVLIHAEGPANIPHDFRAHTKIRESILRELVVKLEDAHEAVVRKELESKGPENEAEAAAQLAAAEQRAAEKRARAAASVAETLAAAGAAPSEAAEVASETDITETSAEGEGDTGGDVDTDADSDAAEASDASDDEEN